MVVMNGAVLLHLYLLSPALPEVPVFGCTNYAGARTVYASTLRRLAVETEKMPGSRSDIS